MVPVPSREWALSAVDDLRAEGFSAEVVGQDCDGLWQVRVEGPAGSIAEMRYAMNTPRANVCWETFVNEAVAN